MALGMMVGQLAKAVEVNLQTVRFYERARLLKPPTRSHAGYRLYGETDVQRLLFIKRAQALGFTLKEISELLNLRITSGESCKTVQQKAQAKLATVDRKVKDLRAMARTLRLLLRSCETGRLTNHCPMLESLATMGEGKHKVRQRNSQQTLAKRAGTRRKK